MIKGIDVSRHQGVINWKKVMIDGIDFAIIRAGYGKFVEDNYFRINMDGAIENGVHIGVYWFLYCASVEDAIINANKCDEIIKKYRDYITLKVWCDYEYDSDKYAKNKGAVTDNNFRTNCVIAFCERLKELGWDVGVYANPDYLKHKFTKAVRNYPLWLAQYATSKSYDCFMWQYSSKGKVDGIKGNVDMNNFYGELPKEDLPDLNGYVGISIVAALQSKGYESSFSYRKKLWKRFYPTQKYNGTGEQNLALIELLGGEIEKENDIPSLSGYKGFSIVQALKSFGYPSEFEYRKILWAKIGEKSTYKGTTTQNLKLLNKLRDR